MLSKEKETGKEVSSYEMTLRKRENTAACKKKQYTL
jgi:hypothetical protein